MCSLSRSFRLFSTLMIEEEAMVITKNQGIGSILESNISDETSNKSSSSSSSLRRTLSADMSSTKWLTQNWLSPMKKIASSEEFSICSITNSSLSEEEEEEDDDDDDETEPRGHFDSWSSIIQQKSQVITDLPPYIHPLVKNSAASSLTQKSLQICTESLGSETGSDGLISSYPSSDSGDVTDDDKYMEQERSVEHSFDNFEEQWSVPKYNYVKESLKRRSFPPPMPSRRMQSCRDNGRLILESVSFPSENNNFIAQRRDGRLVLTFASSIEQEEEEEEKEVEEFEEGFGSFDDEGKESDEAEEEEEAAFVMELQAPKVSSRVINLHRLTLMGVANRDTTLTTWPNKFNEVVKFDEVEEDIKPAIVAKSLPPMARLIPKSAAVGTDTAAAAGGCGGGGGASLNAYEYYWRARPMASTQSKSNKKNTQEEQQQLILLRGNKGENLVPLVKSCKEPRRPLLFWEPYCIATS